MKLNEEDKKFIRHMLEEARPIYDKTLEHLCMTDPKGYAMHMEERK